jgi:hypothetical protein
MQFVPERPRTILAALATVLAVSTAVFVTPHFYAQEWLGRSLRNELGFATESPWYEIDGRTSEVFELRVKPSGAFAKAGVRDGDTPIEYMRHGKGFTAFYGALEASRGGTFVSLW